MGYNNHIAFVSFVWALVASTFGNCFVLCHLCYKTKMANVRDSDTSLWLHNKLGISNDSWTGGSICSQLNAEVLRNIKDCFPDLQTQVKLKLLLSFFHIPRRNLEEVCKINFSIIVKYIILIVYRSCVLADFFC